MTRATREMIELTRTFEATLEDVWDLWTTKDGIESWWGPDGFRVEVRVLDVRPGGTLLYSMIADTPEMRRQMVRDGMGSQHEARITFREVVPHKRLAFTHLADFIPGVAPYDVETVVTLERVGDSVKMTLRFESMHNDVWTQRATAGWTMELAKLARRLQA